MTIGILSDAHGNIFGLKRCIKLLEAQNAEQIFFLGDAVNYFSRPREVLDCLKSRKIKCIKGNHENFLLRERDFTSQARQIYSLDYTQEVLQEQDIRFISSWQDSIELTVGQVKILMVHGSPFNYLEEYVYPDSDVTKFLDLEYDFILMGHTHVPFLRHLGNKLLVNVGSCGFSRDDGRFISCASFDLERGQVNILKDDFPFEHLDDLRPFDSYIHEVLQRRKTLKVN